MHKTAIIILNWNGRSFLEKFLPSVTKFLDKGVALIVADNDSKDDSIEFLEKNYPEIRIIKNTSNGGFAKGYNEALKHVEAEYYILLNSDIEVCNDWISPLVRLMGQDPLIGAAQPKILSYHQKSHFEYAGAAGGFIDHFGYPFCRGRIFQKLEEDKGQYDKSCELFWATGACMIVRAEVFHKFGGFDEDFFAHMEEIDFCWRIKNAGYRVLYCPESKVYHVGGGTLPKRSAQKTYLNMRNNIAMLYKNLPPNRLAKVLLIRFFLDFIASLKFLVDGGIKDFIAVVRAYFSFYSKIKVFRSKRERLVHNEVSGMYYGNIVFDHYIMRKKKFSDLNIKKFSKKNSAQPVKQDGKNKDQSQ